MPNNSTNRGLSSGTWVNTLTIKTTNSIAGGCVIINGTIYCIGGYNDSGTRINNVDSYNISTNTWTSKNSLPTTYTTGIAYNSCSIYNGIIYSFGGYNYDGTSSKKIYKYDISADTWSTNLNDMPYARWFHSSIVIGNTIWIFGGYDGSTYTNTIWSYAPDSDTWNTTSYRNMEYRRGQMGCAAIGNKIYLLGGYSSDIGGNFDGALYSYETTTNILTRLSDAPMSFQYSDVSCKNLFSYGNYLYTLNARYGWNNTKSRVLLRYNTLKDIWSVVNESPAVISRQYACLYNNSIYISNSSIDDLNAPTTQIFYKYKLPL